MREKTEARPQKLPAHTRQIPHEVSYRKVGPTWRNSRNEERRNNRKWGSPCRRDQPSQQIRPAKCVFILSTSSTGTELMSPSGSEHIQCGPWRSLNGNTFFYNSVCQANSDNVKCWLDFLFRPMMMSESKSKGDDASLWLPPLGKQSRYTQPFPQRVPFSLSRPSLQASEASK